MLGAAPLAVVLIGVAVFIVGMRSQQEPPQPAAPVLSAPVVTSAARPLPRSVPSRVVIPSVKVSAPLLALGLERDGQLQVPPLTQVERIGWYRLGPTPGERGPALLVGHVDSRTGPGVFYRLGQLKPGQKVSVQRKDGTTATFWVYRIERVAKDKFPSRRVYGDTQRPELRLITCGGNFDTKAGHYLDNLIAYAAM
ncbi:class F sortase [Actinomadura rupiterrae]|uniref:class F sortase n=1 Tax=Actinomadura rupiterrae TaxID=559627 RepID=UPI0020A474F7|nr:class F sortase [Actinomadura rupiterrae]MCP2335241.1 sortase (surface protein transpeptidase) [Actinomadura rupiterrae]